MRSYRERSTCFLFLYFFFYYCDETISHLFHKLQVFSGNSDNSGTIKNSLREFASAKFIRFQPKAYSMWKALRVEVYGVLLTKGIYLLLFLSK